MAVQGFAAQAQRNRRLTGLYLALYLGGFFTFTLLVLSPLPVIFGQSGRSLFIDPARYVADYGPIALLVPLLAFARNRYTFARELREMLAIRPVAAGSEPRFARIAETQAMLQGLKMPQLGLIDTAARNALSVGAIGARPMIVVTRGLLDALDDDELAAVLAHEIAHWRLGDTRLLTVNQVLMRTAVMLQAYNPIKVERHPHHRIQWHLLAGIVYPFLIVVLFVGGLLTMTMWRLARFANRMVRTGRDLIADGEAVRMTHFPEALESAIAKCHGRGWFENAERFEAMLFEGASVSQGGTHPEPSERLAALRRNGGGLYAPGRSRADTRIATPPVGALRQPGGFGRRVPALSGSDTGFARANAARPEAKEWTLASSLTLWTDPEVHRNLRRRELDVYSWRLADGRDLFGVARDMRLAAYGSLAASLIAAIAVSNSFSDYVSLVSGRTYLLQADQHFFSSTCSLSKSLQECSQLESGGMNSLD